MAGNNSFSVDTEGLAGAAPTFLRLAARFKGVGSELQAKLEALGACWGDDKTGQQFLNQYKKPSENIFEAATGGGEVMSTVVDGIGTMAKQYERQEDENILLTQRLRMNDPETPERTAQGRVGRSPR